MLKRWKKLWRLFRFRILLSYFSFIRTFLYWLAIYFYINFRQAGLDHFQTHLANLQNHYGEANRDLQNFIIAGHRQPAFYTTGRQKDIDQFESDQRLIIQGLAQIKQEARDHHINIQKYLDTLVQLHQQLIDSVAMLRHYYFIKGFKDFGAEGKMRDYAHYLEDSTPIQKADILMLRRREKDFMLRGEQKYGDEFNALIDSQMEKFSMMPATHAALLNYKLSFNDFADYARRLGINTDRGLYSSMEAIINNLDDCYRHTNGQVDRDVAFLNYWFKIILIVTFLAVVGASIYLSIVLSKNLTKDIHKLNKRVAAFVRSGFKEDPDNAPLDSKIAEIQGLNDNFTYLEKVLLKTLADLGKSIEEEKDLSARLQVAMTRQNNQLIISAHQQAELQQYRLMLTTMLRNTAGAVIVFDSDMEVIFFNPAAETFVYLAAGKELIPGGAILEYLPEAHIYALTKDIEAALAGKETAASYDTVSNGTPMQWYISLHPVVDDEETIFAVVLIAGRVV